jgi:hypothetical protein
MVVTAPPLSKERLKPAAGVQFEWKDRGSPAGTERLNCATEGVVTETRKWLEAPVALSEARSCARVSLFIAAPGRSVHRESN